MMHHGEIWVFTYIERRYNKPLIFYELRFLLRNNKCDNLLRRIIRSGYRIRCIGWTFGTKIS